MEVIPPDAAPQKIPRKLGKGALTTAGNSATLMAAMWWGSLAHTGYNHANAKHQAALRVHGAQSCACRCVVISNDDSTECLCKSVR